MKIFCLLLKKSRPFLQSHTQTHPQSPEELNLILFFQRQSRSPPTSPQAAWIIQTEWVGVGSVVNCGWNPFLRERWFFWQFYFRSITGWKVCNLVRGVTEHILVCCDARGAFVCRLIIHFCGHHPQLDNFSASWLSNSHCALRTVIPNALL